MSINFDDCWALIKDGKVLNTIFIEEASERLMDALKTDLGADEIINCGPHKTTPTIGVTWNGKEFGLPPEPENILPPIIKK